MRIFHDIPLSNVTQWFFFFLCVNISLLLDGIIGELDFGTNLTNRNEQIFRFNLDLRPNKFIFISEPSALCWTIKLYPLSPSRIKFPPSFLVRISLNNLLLQKKRDIIFPLCTFNSMWICMFYVFICPSGVYLYRVGIFRFTQEKHFIFSRGKTNWYFVRYKCEKKRKKFFQINWNMR